MQTKNRTDSYIVKFVMNEETIRFLASFNTPGKKPRKFTRFQAFADLTERFYIAALKKHDDGIPVSELATIWGWSSPKAYSYLRKLEELNIIATSKIGNCNFVAPKPQNFALAGENQQNEQLHVGDEENAPATKI